MTRSQPITEALRQEVAALREVGDIIRELNDCGFDDAIELIDRLTKQRDEAEAKLARIPDEAVSPPKPDYFELAGELGTRAMKLHEALESIAAWRKVNIQGEYEHGLRDIIRSITDCAAAALDASTVSRPNGNTP